MPNESKPRYIDAEVLKSKVHVQTYKGDPAVLMALGWVYKTIDYTPTADVAPVRHSTWKLGICQSCMYDWGNNVPIASVPPYCPNCGALMDKTND